MEREKNYFDTVFNDDCVYYYFNYEGESEDKYYIETYKLEYLETTDCFGNKID